MRFFFQDVIAWLQQWQHRLRDLQGKQDHLAVDD
jgi:hypothetical protein